MGNLSGSSTVVLHLPVSDTNAQLADIAEVPVRDLCNSEYDTSSCSHNNRSRCSCRQLPAIVIVLPSITAVAKVPSGPLSHRSVYCDSYTLSHCCGQVSSVNGFLCSAAIASAILCAAWSTVNSVQPALRSQREYAEEDKLSAASTAAWNTAGGPGSYTSSAVKCICRIDLFLQLAEVGGTR